MTKPLDTKTPDAKPEVATVAKAHVVPDEPVADPLLVQILSTRRSHSSTGDINFRLWLFNYIKTTLKLTATIEAEGCILVQTDPKSTVLFSCHVDTMHSKMESNGQSQQLSFDPAFGHLFLSDKGSAGCLGGDDGCGVYIMLKMLKAGIRGKYIFHTGEERGAIGSTAFVKARKQFCEELEMVVAFDRAVKSGENPEVVLAQGGNSCASEEFGKALCVELNKTDFEYPYVISHSGVFTDSKIYRNIVPECVNLGCFYQHQHGPNEYVDVNGLEKLVTAACSIDWTKLPIVRNPAKTEMLSSTPKPKIGYSGNGLWGDFDLEDSYAERKKQKAASVFSKPAQSAPPIKVPEFSLEEELGQYSLDEFNDFVVGEPDAAVVALMQMTLKIRALEAELKAAKNMLGI